MSFIARELTRLEAAIAEEPLDTDRFRQLFAARQALSWAMEPTGFKSPLDSINNIQTSSVSIPPTG